MLCLSWVFQFLSLLFHFNITSWRENHHEATKLWLQYHPRLLIWYHVIIRETTTVFFRSKLGPFSGWGKNFWCMK